METYILGIDIGTSSSKALAYTLNGTTASQHQIRHQTLHPEEHAAEQDPKALLRAVTEVVKNVVSKMKKQPIALSFSFAMHGVMAVDTEGAPISRLLLWNDNRSKKEAALFKANQEAPVFYQHTGTPIHPMSPFCKLLWWKKNHPVSFSTVDKFISFQEYLFSELFGGYYISYSLASSTGLFDHSTLDWYEPALHYIGITRENLATPLPPTHIFRGLKAEYTQLLGLRSDLPFVLGAGDGCLANLGSGVTGEKQMAVTIGTSGAIRITGNAPIATGTSNNGSLFNYLLTEKEFISGSAINNGGNLLDWYKNKILMKKELPYHEILKDAFQAKAGCNGLLFLPYLYGERGPMWDADTRGCFWGISHHHKRKDFIRSIIEGICYALYHNAKILMNASQKEISQIFVSGGFVHSKTWVQMLADVFQQEARVTHHTDVSTMGAVFLGFKALGIIEDWSATDQYISVTHSFSPNEKRGAVYKRNFALYSKMYPLTKNTMHEVANWEKE